MKAPLPRGSHRYDLAPIVPVAELTEAEAAAFLGMPVRTLKTLRARGQGPKFYKIGLGPKARVRYRPEHLREWNHRRTKLIDPATVKKT
jgi:hypothetical protein